MRFYLRLVRPTWIITRILRLIEPFSRPFPFRNALQFNRIYYMQQGMELGWVRLFELCILDISNFSIDWCWIAKKKVKISDFSINQLDDEGSWVVQPVIPVPFLAPAFALPVGILIFRDDHGIAWTEISSRYRYQDDGVPYQFREVAAPAECNLNWVRMPFALEPARWESMLIRILQVND